MAPTLKPPKNSKYKKAGRDELLGTGVRRSNDELEAAAADDICDSPQPSSANVADEAEAEASSGAAQPWHKRCRNNLIESVGTLAGICTTAAFVPQVFEIWITGDTSGLSLPMYSIFVFGVFLWMAYGVCKRAGSLVVANLITFVLAGYILCAILDRVVFHPENYAVDVDGSYVDEEIMPLPLNDSSLPQHASSPPPPLLPPK